MTVFSSLTDEKEGREDNCHSLGLCEFMEAVILKVYLQPKSSKNEIIGPFRDGIKVKITAPPVEGKANEGLIRFLSKEWGIPVSHIEIVRGRHSREKTLKISTESPLEFTENLLK
jgi:uncharacterized protein (TIGR00251 family)